MANCPNCGAPLEENMDNCSYCGWQRSGSSSVLVNENSGEQISNSSTNDIELQSAYITGKTKDFSYASSLDYYLNVFKSFDLNGEPTFKFKWNWASFLLGGWHLIYRKNYLWGIISIVIFTLLPGWGFLLSIALGGVGNYLIYRHYLSKLEDVQSAYPGNKTKQIEQLADIGGVNNWVKILVTLYILAYVIIGIGIVALGTLPYNYY